MKGAEVGIRDTDFLIIGATKKSEDLAPANAAVLTGSLRQGTRGLEK